MKDEAAVAYELARKMKKEGKSYQQFKDAAREAGISAMQVLVAGACFFARNKS